MNLGKLRWVRLYLVKFKRLWLVKVFRMDIHPSSQFSLSTKFDLTNPKGIHVGEESYIAFDVAILAHDLTRGFHTHTRIGRRCFVGARSIILPGITIGDESIVGAGSVVTRDVPPRTVVAGNPARVIKTDIVVAGPFGRLEGADARQGRMMAENDFA
ncbi:MULTISPECIES: DapH/DapD/GlmU-related protein [Methylocaldum]|jgi:acetyltransferase-like isoleucine patch superfamily enzyme|uniref:DapH/DapD/GlmU-related protein n=1 Tax=unclassified Methylocaldum TaxID=2622260 RepID=UPI0012EB221D|nr:acyltransferase [Methylocaldum sp. BRCS4]